MLKSSFWDYSDAYILASGAITVVGERGDHAAGEADIIYKQAIFKTCVLFTDSITEINNTQLDNAKDLDGVIPMYNLIEHSDNYSKTSGSLYQIML